MASATSGRRGGVFGIGMRKLPATNRRRCAAARVHDVDDVTVALAHGRKARHSRATMPLSLTRHPSRSVVGVVASRRCRRITLRSCSGCGCTRRRQLLQPSADPVSAAQAGADLGVRHFASTSRTAAPTCANISIARHASGGARQTLGVHRTHVRAGRTVMSRRRTSAGNVSTDARESLDCEQ